MTIITNYGQLKTAIAGKVNRTDLTTFMPGFVQRSEEEFNRIMRQLNNLYYDPAFSFTAEFTTAPADMQEIVSIEFDGKKPLSVIAPGYMSKLAGATGDPVGFMMIDDKIRLRPAPSSPMTGTLIYYRGVETITGDDNDTNWLLDAHSAVYLYRGCMEASLHMKNATDVQSFGSAYQAAMASVLKAGRKRRQSSDMRVRLG